MNDIERDLQYWHQLKLLANNDDISGFFTLYYKYLEWRNIINPNRQILYKMSQLVATKYNENTITYQS